MRPDSFAPAGDLVEVADRGCRHDFCIVNIRSSAAT